jgi:hypothetical protein
MWGVSRPAVGGLALQLDVSEGLGAKLDPALNLGDHRQLMEAASSSTQTHWAPRCASMRKSESDMRQRLGLAHEEAREVLEP